MEIYIGVKTKEQLEAVVEYSRRISDVRYNIIVDHSILDEQNIDEMLTKEDSVHLALPEVARENKLDIIEGYLGRLDLDGVVVKNIDELGLIRTSGMLKAKCSSDERDTDGASTFDKGQGIEVIADPYLYAYNPGAMEFYLNIIPGLRFIASDELTDAEIEKFPAAQKQKMISKIYGRQRLMVTAQNTVAGLKQDGEEAIFKNSKGDRFEAIYDKVQEYSLIYNDLPTFMLDKVEADERKSYLVDFTVESGAETKQILNMVADFAAGKSVEIPKKMDITRGHHFKGVD